jgi:hypothetical protein
MIAVTPAAGDWLPDEIINKVKAPGVDKNINLQFYGGVKMKKIIVCLALAAFFICAARDAALAQQALALEGNEYNIRLFPRGDAGSYCEKDTSKKETFEFNYGNAFIIQSFDDTVDLDEHVMDWLHDYFGEDEQLGGTYTEDGAAFKATYNMFDNSYNYYKFTIDKGRNLFNLMLFGSMNIKYYEPVWKSMVLFEYIDRWDLKDEAEAKFFGMKD